MDSYLVLMVVFAAIWLSGPLIVISLALLWVNSRSPWLVLALVGALASFLVRLAVSIEPSLLGKFAMTQVVPPTGALMLAIGLLGYALSREKLPK